jgi:hypothetical protein
MINGNNLLAEIVGQVKRASAGWAVNWIELTDHLVDS